MIITPDDIRADIKQFQKRLYQAHDDLKRLPQGYLSYYDHRVRKRKQAKLEAEIKHIEELLRLAREAL